MLTASQQLTAVRHGGGLRPTQQLLLGQSAAHLDGSGHHSSLTPPCVCLRVRTAHSSFLQVGPKAFPRVAMDLATTVERIQQNFVICDPSLPDCPIVFASDAFLELTGYPREEVLGRNCRFLQVGRVVFVRIFGGGCVQEWGCC